MKISQGEPPQLRGTSWYAQFASEICKKYVCICMYIEVSTVFGPSNINMVPCWACYGVLVRMAIVVPKHELYWNVRVVCCFSLKPRTLMACL